MEPRKRNAEQELALKNAVVEGYLETGKEQTVAQIAERLGWSTSKVYKVLRDSHGAPHGVEVRESRSESYSTSYRSFQSGSHKIYVYTPSLSTLRQLILDARKPASEG